MKNLLMLLACVALATCLADDVRARYEDELYNRVVPFWAEHSIDRECGGYLTCLDREGNVYDTTKDVWLEWREVYMFAALNNRGRRNPDWVALAKHGYDFLHAKARRADGSYVTVMNRDGSKTTTAAPLVAIFSHAFAAMACAELHRATGEEKYRAEALSCWKHYRRIWATSEGEWRQLSYRVLGLNVMNVFNVCFKGAFADEAKAIAAELPRFVEPKTGLMCERVKPDWKHDFSSQYGRFVNSGHTVEAMSFLFDHILITGDRTFLDFGAKMAIKMFNFGWDAEKGGGFVYRDALGKPCEKTDWMLKTWWADCEAATAMLRGWKLTGDGRFLERFKAIDAYDWANFRDPDFPEWFAYAPVEGRRCHTYKGNVRKGFFHLPRRLLDCLELMDDGGASPRGSAAPLKPEYAGETGLDEVPTERRNGKAMRLLYLYGAKHIAGWMSDIKKAQLEANPDAVTFGGFGADHVALALPAPEVAAAHVAGDAVLPVVAAGDGTYFGVGPEEAGPQLATMIPYVETAVQVSCTPKRRSMATINCNWGIRWDAGKKTLKNPLVYDDYPAMAQKAGALASYFAKGEFVDFWRYNFVDDWNGPAYRKGVKEGGYMTKVLGAWGGKKAEVPKDVLVLRSRTSEDWWSLRYAWPQKEDASMPSDRYKNWGHRLFFWTAARLVERATPFEVYQLQREDVLLLRIRPSSTANPLNWF